MSHIILGLFGMILSVWSMIASTIFWNLEIYMRISGLVFLLSVCSMVFSYAMFCSSCTRLYIRLPSEKKPFCGIKLYVVLFGLFHLAVGVAAYWITGNWLIYILLLSSSFIFCVDAYSCFFTDSYMLCEHRENQYEMRAKEPIDGIIYSVVVRTIFESSKKLVTDLPDGFQFDYELIVEESWFGMV